MSLPQIYQLCTIFDEREGRLRRIRPTPYQERVVKRLSKTSRLMVIKYRQAYVTTIAVLWLLCEIMPRKGWQGYLIADTHDTSSEAFSRLLQAYENFPESVKRAFPAERAGASHLVFRGGGGIKTLTAGSKHLAIGRSIDRLVCSEIGMWPDLQRSLKYLTPAYRKRPHSKVLFESTPGPAGCWMETMHRQGTFDTEFLLWKNDPAIVAYPGGPEAFKADLLSGEYAGDELVWENQYPSDEFSGYTTISTPSLPTAVLQLMLGTAIPNLALPREANATHIITSDPAGFGASGDPSGITVWAISDSVRDVYSWAGRIDPGDLATKIMALQAQYDAQVVAVESNAAACVQALRMANCPGLHWTTKDKPGWQATEASRLQAVGALAGLLRTGKMTIRSRDTLTQCLTYDAGNVARIAGHHHDLVVCAYIAASLAERYTKQDRIPSPILLPESDPNRGMPVSVWRKMKARQDARR